MHVESAFKSRIQFRKLNDICLGAGLYKRIGTVFGNISENQALNCQPSSITHTINVIIRISPQIITTIRSLIPYNTLFLNNIVFEFDFPYKYNIRLHNNSDMNAELRVGAGNACFKRRRRIRHVRGLAFYREYARVYRRRDVVRRFCVVTGMNRIIVLLRGHCNSKFILRTWIK